MSLLAFAEVRGGYGGADVLQGVSLSVAAGDIVVLVGPNGAGKSTLMKAAFGLVTVRDGRITWRGTDIANLRPDRIARLGLAFVPQERNVFAALTVEENLEMGAYLRADGAAAARERVYALFPRLAERRKQQAGTMSGGERQMVAIGRALMAEPSLLMLDEPTAGLSPRFVEETLALVQRINAEGVTILMVEQNVRPALAIAHRAHVLAMGRHRHEDTGPGLLANPEIASLFLGG